MTIIMTFWCMQWTNYERNVKIQFLTIFQMCIRQFRFHSKRSLVKEVCVCAKATHDKKKRKTCFIVDFLNYLHLKCDQ